MLLGFYQQHPHIQTVSIVINSQSKFIYLHTTRDDCKYDFFFVSFLFYTINTRRRDTQGIMCSVVFILHVNIILELCHNGKTFYFSIFNETVYNVI